VRNLDDVSNVAGFVVIGRKAPLPAMRRQLLNANPIKSPSRQIIRHLRMVRKLSKVNSKSIGMTGKSCMRMLVPTLETSLTKQERTPL
jgi:hypothetical protein